MLFVVLNWYKVNENLSKLVIKASLNNVKKIHMENLNNVLFIISMIYESIPDTSMKNVDMYCSMNLYCLTYYVWTMIECYRTPYESWWSSENIVESL